MASQIPYRSFPEAQQAAKAVKTSLDDFSPEAYLNYTCAYSAAVAYFQKYGGRYLFENISRSYSASRPITFEDLPKIAKIMQEKGLLVESGTKGNWVSHMYKILNARRGGGDALKGYLESFISDEAIQLKVKKTGAPA